MNLRAFLTGVFLVCAFSYPAKADEEALRSLLRDFRIGSEFELLANKYSIETSEFSYFGQPLFSGHITIRSADKFKRFKIEVGGRSDAQPRTVELISIEKILPRDWDEDQVTAMLQSVFGETYQYWHYPDGDERRQNTHAYLWGYGCHIGGWYRSISGVTSYVRVGKSSYLKDHYILELTIKEAKFLSPFHDSADTEEEARTQLEQVCANWHERWNKN